MSVATLPETNHAEWLAKRRKGIGASEAAAVLGLSPYRTALSVYAEKIGLEPPQETNTAMLRGLRREPIILEDYCAEQGLLWDELDRQVFLAHKAWPWMLATFDAVREIDGIPIPVEVKHVGRQSARQWGEGGDLIPPHYLAQVHQQIAVLDAPYAHVVAELAGDYAFFTIQRDDQFISLLETTEAEFWSRVIRKDPPPASSVADIRVLARLNPNPEGEIEIDDDLEVQAVEYKDLGEQITGLGQQRDLIKLQILNALGNSKVARGKSGVKISKTLAQVKERTQFIAAHTQTRLTVTLPKEI